MSGRRHVAAIAGAVALSGAAWGLTQLAWDDAAYRRPPERVTHPAPDEVDRFTLSQGMPPCTPPPGQRSGTYTCAFLHTQPPDP